MSLKTAKILRTLKAWLKKDVLIKKASYRDARTRLTRPYTQHKMRPRPAVRHFKRVLQKRYGPTDGRTNGRSDGPSQRCEDASKNSGNGRRN